MIPVTASDIGTIEFDNTEEVIRPSLTFKMDFDKGTVSGTVDEVEALKQAVICRLLTQSEKYDIYSDMYGIPLNEMLGQSAPLVYVSVANSIESTLLDDDRILSVSGFVFNADSKNVNVSFNIESVFGTVNFEEVSL